MGLLLLASLLFASTPAQADPWATHRSSLSGRQAKIAGLESEIKGLVHEKNLTDQPEEVRHITLTMEEKYKALKTLASEQREEQLHIRFKHPEKGDESAREYSRYKMKSLGEMENEFGLDAKLDRIRDQVRVTYGLNLDASKIATEAKPHAKTAAERTPASEGSGEQSERILLSK